MNFYKYLLIPVVFFIIQLLIIFLCTGCAKHPEQYNSYISAPALGSKIEIRTLAQGAGAIGSLMWNNHEFINATDHGRELQSDLSFSYTDDYGRLNPTEAGSNNDADISNGSSSRLLELIAKNNYLTTTVEPAWWSPLNKELRSKNLISKRVTIGYKGFDNVIQYDVDFTVTDFQPMVEFETLTAYMPPDFNTYWKLQNNAEVPLPSVYAWGYDWQGTMISTSDQKYAMGVIELETNTMYVNWGSALLYDGTSKWSTIQITNNVQPGTYTFHMLVVIGSLDQVTITMRQLNAL